MSSIPNVVENAGSQTRAGGLRGSLMPSLFAAVMGLGLIFSAGFIEKAEVHNAAHDARHSAGFPCH